MYQAEYSVSVTYQDRKGPGQYTINPSGTKFLGFPKTMTLPQARKAEAAYKAWTPGEPVTVRVNNLGGVHAVLHDGMELGPEDAR